MTCPNDTDGDGDCGKPYCPYCGPKVKEHRQVTVVDGVELVAGDVVTDRETLRALGVPEFILATGHGDASQNGIYVISSATWERA